MRPGLRVARRLALLPLIFSLYACASTASRSPEDAAAALDRDMLVTGLSDIDSIYITKQDIGALALSGMQQLASLDPDLEVEGDQDELKLLQKGNLIEAESLEDGPDATAKQWGKAAAKLLKEARAKSSKVSDAGSEKIYEAIFSGIVGKLDGFSRYSGKDSAREERASRDGFGGIGVRISVDDGQVRITAVMHYTPAERLGLKRDDIIQKIDGKSVEGWSQQDVINQLRGEVDSRVILTLMRDGKDKPFDVSVKRAHVVPETVSYRREGDIAYFRIFSFNSGTASSLKREINDAKDEIGKKIKGYVLDLRNNPGGLVPQSVATADLFLDEGRIISVHGRHPDSHQYFESTEGDIAKEKPLVVLIDGNSASAAEIVSAALQDNGRAVLVGTNSYGKGSVQNIQQLPNTGEIKITWARFHAPSGYTLHHLGVLPTICTSGKHNSDELLSELRMGELPAVPVAKRNAAKPDDTKALDELRKTCPARKNEDPVDLELAIKLLQQPSLYQSALKLATPPAGSQVDDAAEALLPFVP